MSAFFDDLTRAIAEPMPRQRALRITVGALAAGLFGTLPRAVHAADCGTRGMCSDGKCCSVSDTHCCPGDLHCCMNSGPLSVCCGLAVCCGPDQLCCPGAHGNGMENGGGCCPAGSTCCGNTCCQSDQMCVNGVCVAANCDVLQSKVDVAAAQLAVDDASVSGLLDQMQNQSTAAAGLAPELGPFVVQVSNALGGLSATYQADPGAFAAATQAWALGPGAQQINDLVAQSATASNGLAAAIAANVQTLLTVLQSVAQNAVADAQMLADAQAALDACKSASFN